MANYKRAHQASATYETSKSSKNALVN